MKVISVNNNSDSNGEYYTQNIMGIIKNGKYKNKKMFVTNTASFSKVYDDTIHKNSDLFVELSSGGNSIISILNIKRDKYLVILLVLFVDILVIIAGNKSFKILFSLLVNIIISACSIFIFSKYRHLNLLVLYIIVSIIFITLSLLITNGKCKKTAAAIVSSIGSLFITFTLSFILIKLFGRHIPIWSMEYIEVIYEYQNYFYVSILLCGLGAIMDISITIASSINELVMKNPNIELNVLKKSGQEISKDIIGTMTNVMLFTCYSSVIPTVLLAVRNNMMLSGALSLYGQVELIIVLCSCISIVLSIPISLYTSLLLIYPTRKEVKS